MLIIRKDSTSRAQYASPGFHLTSLKGAWEKDTEKNIKA